MRYPTTPTERKVGLLVLAGCCAMVVMFVLSGREIQLFQKYVRYKTSYEQGYGLKIGTQVQVKGLNAGVVEDFVIDPGGNIVLQLKVQKKLSPQVRKNSKAVLIVAPFFGDPVIDIQPGSEMSEEAAEGDFLQSVVPADFLEAFSRVALQTSEALTDIQQGQGNIGQTIVNVKEITEDLKPAVQSVTKTASGFSPVLENIQSITSDLKPAAQNFTVAAEKLPELSDRTTHMLGHLEEASEKIKQTSGDVKDITGMVKETLDDMQATQQDVRDVLTSLRNMTADLEKITHQIAEGEGTIGKLVQDDEIYRDTRDMIDSAHQLVTSIARIQVLVHGDHFEYIDRGVGISHLTAKIVPRDTRYFHIGGAFFTFRDGSETSSRDNFELEPEIMVAQKLFEKKITVRAGLLEGRFGGGMDVRLWDGYLFSGHHADDADEDTSASPWRQSLSLAIELRDTFDRQDFNENIDTLLLRGHLNYRFYRFFHLYAGVDNILDQAAFVFGLGFTYRDEDISKVLGFASITK